MKALKIFSIILDVFIIVALIIEGFVFLFGGKETIDAIFPSTVGLLCFIGADYMMKHNAWNREENKEISKEDAEMIWNEFKTRIKDEEND